MSDDPEDVGVLTRVGVATGHRDGWTPDFDVFCAVNDETTHTLKRIAADEQSD